MYTYWEGITPYCRREFPDWQEAVGYGEEILIKEAGPAHHPHQHGARQWHRGHHLAAPPVS